MTSYPALIRQDKDKTYRIDFPDFPGCDVARGRTMGEAMQRAIETLDRYAGSVAAKGDALPDPTPLGTVAACRDANGAVISLIPLRASSTPWRRDAGTLQKLAC